MLHKHVCFVPLCHWLHVFVFNQVNSSDPEVFMRLPSIIVRCLFVLCVRSLVVFSLIFPCKWTFVFRQCLSAWSKNPTTFVLSVWNKNVGENETIQVSKSFNMNNKLVIFTFLNPINISFKWASKISHFTQYLYKLFLQTRTSLQEVLPLPLYCNTSGERNTWTQIKIQGNERELWIIWFYLKNIKNTHKSDMTEI